MATESQKIDGRRPVCKMSSCGELQAGQGVRRLAQPAEGAPWPGYSMLEGLGVGGGEGPRRHNTHTQLIVCWINVKNKIDTSEISAIKKTWCSTKHEHPEQE